MENMTRDDDPHYFLYLFDTVFLVDDSTSMLGPRWREVRSALRQITPVCTSHDDDGIDIHFMNHRSSENTTTNNNNNSDDGISSQSGGGMARGKARGGYYNITDPLAVDALFQRLRPCGPTHTRGRIEDILEPYFTQLESAENVQDVRPLNLIVITDGMPGPCPRHVNFSGSGFGSGFNGNGEAAPHNPHLPDPAIVRYARRLDELRAPAWQVGVQFFQVGDDAAATASLRGLDDGLARRHGVRDIVDTLKFGDDDYKTLTAEEILKAVLGAVSRRLDNQSCEREGGGRSGRRASRPLRR
ncbi:von Willebrand factor [Purpureocillium lilacinum]|uniref:von Willebrand factor n=1 Tax=Purpureocillium lilacinum TaxID=33203 RepID=A0A179GQK8_PURLI|nr:von Willebrand factor [Purpureocillium lilacinum]